MALHFVKTAVLSSSDGVDFGTEVAVESEDTRKARADAEAATRKPLFQQLADLRDKKQEEFDENKKKIFGIVHRRHVHETCSLDPSATMMISKSNVLSPRFSFLLSTTKIIGR
jgi:FAM192A/Fyv6, N-terminal domain